MAAPSNGGKGLPVPGIYAITRKSTSKAPETSGAKAGTTASQKAVTNEGGAVVVRDKGSLLACPKWNVEKAASDPGSGPVRKVMLNCDGAFMTLDGKPAEGTRIVAKTSESASIWTVELKGDHYWVLWGDTNLCLGVPEGTGTQILLQTRVDDEPPDNQLWKFIQQ